MTMRHIMLLTSDYCRVQTPISQTSKKEQAACKGRPCWESLFIYFTEYHDNDDNGDNNDSNDYDDDDCNDDEDEQFVQCELFHALSSSTAGTLN